MNVLFIWDGEYPWDIRVEKVANVIMASGHNVHLVCRNENRKPRNEVYKGIHVHRVAALPKMFGRLNSAFTFPAFFSPVWLWELWRVFKKESCSLIIARDLPMAPAAVVIKALSKAPVVLDMAECYPEMLRCAWQFEPFRFANFFARNPKIADWIEHWTLQRVAHVFVMVEESRDRLLRQGVPSERISIVSNTPDLERFSAASLQKGSSNSRYQIVYVGLLNASRGVDTLLEAASLLPQTLNFHVRIIGSGKHGRILKEKAEALQLGSRVTFDGWMNNSEIPTAIAESSVGIVPHYACSHWNNTIPNKLFDYMAAGKPVIVSDAVPAARIVRETGSGLVYSGKCARDLAKVIEAMADTSIQTRMGMAGRAAVDVRYNWGKDAGVLTAIINSFVVDGGL